MAARIRVLLANPNVTTAVQVADSKLWDDADFRWLTGLSESRGVTYINKECFEEMVWWLQLPRLLGGGDAVEIAALAAAAAVAAKAAGYDLAKLRKALVATVKPSAAVLVEAKPVPVESEKEPVVEEQVAVKV
jgi:hypothetical protein